MEPAARMTAEQFARERFDLPEGGRWFELIAGELVQLEPPDEAHGNVVLNFSKALGAYFQQAEATATAYACFEVGLLVSRDPDTVRVPAVACFQSSDERRFAHADEAFTEVRPALVIDIASTRRRRLGLADRVTQFLDWGVDHVWVADPVDRRLHIYRRGQPLRQFAHHQRAGGAPVLPGFTIRIDDLFAEPAWWRG